MMTSAEVQNPRAVIPRATRKIYFRLGLFYVIGMLALGIICPDDAPELGAALQNGSSGSAASPWVIGLKMHGVNGLANLVNAMVLTSAWSCGNAYVYASSRTLYALAVNGKAPAIFKRCLGNGVPVYALAATAAVSCLAFLNTTNKTNTVLNWFINLSSVSFLITYMIIFITHIRFRAAVHEQIGLESLYFRMPLTNVRPYVCYFGFAFAAIILFFNGFYIFWPGAFNAADFISAYFGVFFFIVVYAGSKIYFRSSFVKASEANLFAGKQEIDEKEAEFIAIKSGIVVPWYDKIFNWFF